MAKPSDRSYTHPVRVRRTSSGDGQSTAAFSVFCTHRGRSLPIDECSSCEFCDGFTLDFADRNSMLRCRRPTDLSSVEREPGHDQTSAGVTPIAEVMTAAVWCVTADVSVETVTAVFLERGISGAPVVDDDGFPIGLITKTDLLRERRVEGDTEDHQPLRIHTLAGDQIDLGPGFHADRVARATVGEIMTPVAFTLPERAPLARAAALMSFEGVHRIPVVSDEGQVVGILSALDIVKWVARQDGFIVP